MKKINLIIVFALLGASTFAQERMGPPVKQKRTGNFMAGIAFDVFKSDYKDRIGNKLQGGLEINYFVLQRFSVSAGVEMWTEGDSKISGVAGIRYYPLKNIFLRTRGLMGADDISLGAGFQKMLSEQWTAEGMFDYYLEGEIAARIGLAFLLVKKTRLEHN